MLKSVAIGERVRGGHSALWAATWRAGFWHSARECWSLHPGDAGAGPGFAPAPGGAPWHPLSGQLPRATIDCGAENAGTARAVDHAMAVANTWRPLPRGPRLRQQLAEAQAKRDFTVQRVRRAAFTVRRRVSSGLRIGHRVAVRSDRPAQPAL